MKGTLSGAVGVVTGATLMALVWRWHGEVLHWLFSRGDVA